MNEHQKHIFQILFAGACVAFGLPFLLIEIISLIFGMELYETYQNLFGVLYISLYVLGGIVGSALVSRNVETKQITRTGVITGLVAFFIQQIVAFLFFGAGALGDSYTMFALIGGSLMGSIYARQNRKRLEKELAEREEKEEIVEEPSEEED